MEEVVTDLLSDEHIEWLEPERSWAAHIKVTGASGVVGYLLASPEWQEGRFDGQPRRSAFLLTSADEGEVHEALSRLAKAVRSHVQGHGRWETTRGRFGRRDQVLVLPTDEGEWRIGKRWTRSPTL
jgi:hypothetical protein